MKKARGLIACTATAFFAASVTLAAAPKPTPTAEHQRLALFVGKWKLAGTFSGTLFHAEETCEWFHGGFAVLCRVSSPDGGQELAIFTYNRVTKSYGYYSINDSGNVNSQHGSVQGDVWTFVADSSAPGNNARVMVKPRPDGFALTITVDGSDGKQTVIEESTYTKI